MKNIHVLPTDKPSRLVKGETTGRLLLHDTYGTSTDRNETQNIYITSDEEIKEGDWHLNIITNKISKYNIGLLNPNRSNYKKIILTTDQDLIKDGIQAISNEFLEWFVKNPSCESVDVKKESEFYRSGPLDRLGYSIVTYKIIIPEKITRCCGRCNGVDDLCYSDMTCDNHKERGCEICYGKRIEYQITIPKEEVKQKTLEEAATNYLHRVADGKRNTGYADEDFINGAKWQAGKVFNDDVIQTLEKALVILLKRQERMYNENEVELIANEMVNWAIDNVGNPNPQSGRKFDEVIAKFKNK